MTRNGPLQLKQRVAPTIIQTWGISLAPGYCAPMGALNILFRTTGLPATHSAIAPPFIGVRLSQRGGLEFAGAGFDRSITAMGSGYVIAPSCAYAHCVSIIMTVPNGTKVDSKIMTSTWV